MEHPRPFELPDNYAERQEEGRADQQLERREKLRRLWVEKLFMRDPGEEAARSTGEEDFANYMEGNEQIERYVAVTSTGGAHGDGLHYFVKTFPHMDDAVEYTVEHIADDIFVEIPVAVVDLDLDRQDEYGTYYPLKRVDPVYF